MGRDEEKEKEEEDSKGKSAVRRPFAEERVDDQRRRRASENKFIFSRQTTGTVGLPSLQPISEIRCFWKERISLQAPIFSKKYGF